MEKNPAALDIGGAQRVIIATFGAWIGSNLNPNGKYRFITLNHGEQYDEINA